MGWFDKYCEICGVKVDKKASQKRFGKDFCSEGHAEEYVAKVEAMKKKSSKQGSGGCC